jgi:enolase
MADARIADVVAWEALDSRGRPTVGCEVTVRSGATGAVAVPSGASTGSHEALELRDGDPARYAGAGVRVAVQNAEGPLAAAVLGMDARDWRAVDEVLAAEAGGGRLERLGANAALAVSLACVQAAAADARAPLFRILAEGRAPELPLPMVNILSGGAHAGGAIDLQDLLAIPVGAPTFGDAIRWTGDVRRAAQHIARDRGHSAALVADEGGLGLALGSNEAGLELLLAAIDEAGFRPGVDVAMGIDVAANQLTGPDGYRLESEHRDLSATAMVGQLARWAGSYPLISIEDGLGEDDMAGWQLLTRTLGGSIQLIGDDLFATDAARIESGMLAGIANAALIKPNQAGTLTRAERAFGSAREGGYRTIVSARSGDTEDAWLADVAVAWRAGQIKVGSTMRSERTAKWNRLLWLERVVEDIRLADPFQAR